MESVMVVGATVCEAVEAEGLPRSTASLRRYLSDSCLVAASGPPCEDLPNTRWSVPSKAEFHVNAMWSEASAIAVDDVDARSEASSRDAPYTEAAPEAPPGTFLAAPTASIAKSRRGTRRFVAPAVATASPLLLTGCHRTTVTLSGLPKDYGQETLRALLEAGSLLLCCDFSYLPYDFKKTQIFGYAVLNFSTAADAQRAIGHFAGFLMSESRLKCDWSTSIQGLDALIQKYRNSTVMHPVVPSVYRPLLLSDGKSISFPAATVELKPPVVAELIKAPNRFRQT